MKVNGGVKTRRPDSLTTNQKVSRTISTTYTAVFVVRNGEGVYAENVSIATSKCLLPGTAKIQATESTGVRIKDNGAV